MAPNDVRDHLNREPFRPIRIYVTDGSAYDVGAQTSAVVIVTTLVVGLDEGQENVPGRSVYIDTRHITRIEILPRSQESRP